MTSQTVAVHGAGGAQGFAIAARLRAAGHTVRALDSKNADLTNLDTVVNAYTGADAVVIQLPVDFEPVVLTYAETILAALEKAGIARAVFNPAMPVPPAPVGMPFLDARVAIAQRFATVVESAATVAPATRYLENLRQPWSLERIVRIGEIAYPLPAGQRVPWMTLDDLGDTIADVLGQAEPAPLTLMTGPEAVTGDELAARIGRVIGRQVRWVQVPPAEYARLLTPVIGAGAATEIAGFYELEATSPPPPPLPAELVKAGRTSVTEWASRHDWTAA